MNSTLTFFMAGFWMLMVFDCIRNDPEKRTWIWILIFLNIFGAVLYFVIRRLPYLSIPMPAQLKRWTHRQKIGEAEAAAKNIGKSYQFVNLGNVLLDAGMVDRAFNAYEQAIQQDPKNVNALWGLASIAMTRKQFDGAQQHLDQVIAQDPDYKFGDASLAYGRALYEQEEWEAAKAHLIDDVKRWSHPEAVLMLAHIQIEAGETDAAREGLEKMVAKLQGTPKFYLRQKRHLLGKAQALLRRLP